MPSPSEILDILVDQDPRWGTKFYVDPEASRNGGGLRDADPFNDLQDAIDAAADNHNDIVFVAPGNHSVTAQITFDCPGLTVVARDPGGSIQRSDAYFVNPASSLSSGPVAKILDSVHIRGLAFATRDVDAACLLIDCEEQGGFNGGGSLLEHCRFAPYYGTNDYGVQMIGGAFNVIKKCNFDGLFGGFDVAAIALDGDAGGVDNTFTRVVKNQFTGVGSGKHAVALLAGTNNVLDLIVHSNHLTSGFVASNQGKLIDFGSLASTGMVSDNYVAPLANQAAMISNGGSYAGGFANNHYEES